MVGAIEGGDLAKATALCETRTSRWPTSSRRGAEGLPEEPHEGDRDGDLASGRGGGSFKRYLWALGTVGSSAPFVGLFGTVVGI